MSAGQQQRNEDLKNLELLLKAPPQTEDAIVALGERLYPDLAGLPEGFYEKGIEFLRKNLCSHTCQMLSSKSVKDIDIALSICDLLVAAYGRMVVPMTLTYNVAVYLLSRGVMPIINCQNCPLKNESC